MSHVKKPNKQVKIARYTRWDFLKRRSRFAFKKPLTLIVSANKMKTILIFIINIVVINASTASNNLVVPKDVSEFISSQDCVQVSDFFEHRPSIEKPPYALKVKAWNKTELAVWCTTDTKQVEYQRSYTLLLKFDNKNHPLSNCASKIENVKFIGGLSFVRVQDPNEWFYYIKSKEKVDNKEKMSSIGILSMYDGTGHIYTCVNGKWAARFLH